MCYVTYKFRFVCVNIRNISQKTTHCISLWHIQILILPETNMNLLWYLKGTQSKTLRRENKSSETFNSCCITIGFDFDRSQKSICQEAEIRQCESKAVWTYYDYGVWTDWNWKGQDDSGREKTNSWESPVLYYHYLQRVEWKKHLVWDA